MKLKILTALIFVVFVFSCKDSKKGQRILTESSGNINTLLVVVDNTLWKNTIGDAIREILAAPVDGLPQDEPLFTLSQMPPQVFSGFATKSRIVLKIEIGEDNPQTTKFLKDVYARPQKIVLISGKTTNDIITQLKNNAEKIVAVFKEQEIAEKQKRISKSLFNDKKVEEKLGFSIKLPSVYRIAKEGDNFFWIRKDITTGTTNLMLFELPLTALKENDSLSAQIVKLRDSIGKAHIPGPTDGSYMITEKKYSPFFFKTEIAGLKTYETKGTWEVKNAFMAGPFVNYILKDETRSRYVVLEGFAFAPSVEKRDYMFELEAIIKSIKFTTEAN